MSLPDLHTPRLHLSAATSFDAWELWRLWQDPEVRTPPRAAQPIALHHMVDALQVCSAPGARLWAVRFGASRWPLGWASLRPAPGAWGKAVDLAVALLPAAWESGYAREAAQAVLRHAFDGGSASFACAVWHADDVRGQRLLERLGFRLRRFAGEAEAPARVVQALTVEDFRRGAA